MINFRAATQAIDYLSKTIVKTAIYAGYSAQRRSLLPLVESGDSFYEYCSRLSTTTENQLHAQHDRYRKLLNGVAFTFLISGTTITIAGTGLITLGPKIYNQRYMILPNGEIRFTGGSIDPRDFRTIAFGAALIAAGSSILTKNFNQELDQRLRRQLTGIRRLNQRVAAFFNGCCGYLSVRLIKAFDSISATFNLSDTARHAGYTEP